MTHNGVPIKKAVVVFHNPKGRAGTGYIENGIVTGVTTYSDNDGAPVGKMTITIHEQNEVNGGGYNGVQRKSSVGQHIVNRVPAKHTLPLRYCDPATSGLSVEVHTGSNEVSFDLTE